MSDAAPTADAPRYGGQAVLEGVMMRGTDRWAVAVRRPDGRIWLECHPVPDERPRWQRLPLVRGVFALGDSLGTGMRALKIAADQALEGRDDAPEGGVRLGGSILIAAALAIALFVLLPTSATRALDGLLAATLGDRVLGDGVAFHLVESLLRIVVFLAYLAGVARLPDIRRTFAYHGAEHKTIAAWEHGEPLTPEAVDRFSTRHVRCGTNFLILVMLLAIVVTSVGGLLVPPPAEIGWVGAIGYHVALRLVLLPLIAGLAYEGLRLGAAAGDRAWVRAMMAPGLWLQAITTRPPDAGQLEVAIRSFAAVVPAADLGDRAPQGLPSPVVAAPQGLAVPSGPGPDPAADAPREGEGVDEDGR